jgi:hypothetical protein
MFAEGRQSVNLLRELAWDAIRVYRSLRKKGMRTITSLITYDPRRDPDGSKLFTRQQKALANRWLQYQWGVKPLVNDLYDVTNVFMSKVKLGEHRYAEAKAGTFESFHEKFKSLVVANQWVERGCNWETGMRAKARYRIALPEIKSLQELGLLNLPQVLWEVTPYSFVFDSLINIGEVLESMDALTGVTDLRYYTTTMQKCSAWITFAGGTGTYQQEYFTRSATQTNLPMPKLRFKQSGGMVKALNLVALLRQLR